MSITFDDIEQAAARLRPHALRTPLINSPQLDVELGRPVYFKAECLQATGSFKFRGAYNAISQIAERGDVTDVVAYSSGNHAQGVGLAAKLCGLQAHIVMPDDAPEIKRRNTEALGARIISYDRAGDSRKAIAEKIVNETGGVMVPPFDDEHVIAGQATAGLEIIEQFQDLGLIPEQMLIPCGGGGLSAGVALAFEALMPATEIFACEPEGFDDHARSLAKGEIIGHQGQHTICDALMVRQPGDITFEVNRRLLSGVYVVEDAAVRKAVALAANRLKLVVEPGGAIGLAALLAGKVKQGQGPIAVMLSGGNIDLNLLRDVLGREDI